MNYQDFLNSFRNFFRKKKVISMEMFHEEAKRIADKYKHGDRMPLVHVQVDINQHHECLKTYKFQCIISSTHGAINGIGITPSEALKELEDNLKNPVQIESAILDVVV